jgi:hypothetical protein
MGKGPPQNADLAHFLAIRTVENSGDMWIRDNWSIYNGILKEIAIF